MRVRQLMTHEVFVVNADQPLLSAQRVMKWARTRHVPVVDSKCNVVGLITHRDILAASITSLVREPVDANRDFLASFLIENAMKRHVTCIDPDASLSQAASLMLERKFGCLPVTKDDKLIGIITEADFLSLACFCPEDAVVEQIMSTDLWTADTQNNLFFIEALMEWARVRHVPYVDHNGHLVGIISHRDLLRACFSSLLSIDGRSQESYLRRINVGEIANRDVCTTTPNSRIRDVAKTMLDMKIGALPVLDGDELVGIVTEADLVKVVARVDADLDSHGTRRNSVFLAHSSPTPDIMSVIKLSSHHLGHHPEVPLRQVGDTGNQATVGQRRQEPSPVEPPATANVTEGDPSTLDRVAAPPPAMSSAGIGPSYGASPELLLPQIFHPEEYRRIDRTFAFVDLCGFTAFTHDQGDLAAIRLIINFRFATRLAAAKRGVRIAKWLGDGAMLVGIEPAETVATVLELATIINRDNPTLALRAGIARGEVLLVDGDDHIGDVVNLASKLCTLARPKQILAERVAVDDRRKEQPPIRPVTFKMFEEQMSIFEVLYSADSADAADAAANVAQVVS